MKLMTQMNPEELEQFFTDVQHFNDETLPRLEACSDAWTQADVKAFDTGLELISALQTARSFVSSASGFRIDRRIKMMRGYINKIISRKHDISPVDRSTRDGRLIKAYRHVAVVPEVKVDDEGNVTTKSKEEATKQKITPHKERQQEAIRSSKWGETVSGFNPPRPKHYDEWYDQMSDELRSEVEQLSAFHAELAAADELYRSLFKNPMASKTDLSTAARRLRAWDKKILAIYYHADVEWANLTGQTHLLEDPDKKYFDKAVKEADKLLGISTDSVATQQRDNETTPEAEGDATQQRDNETTPEAEGNTTSQRDNENTTEAKEEKPKRRGRRKKSE